MATLMFLMSCILGLACGTLCMRKLRTIRERRRSSRNA